MIGSTVEFLRLATTTTVIVVAWVSDRRTFFDDGGVDLEETRRGRSAAKRRVVKRECGDEGRRRNRVHCSALVFTFFGSTFKAVKDDECVEWGYLLNFEIEKINKLCIFVKVRVLYFT